MEQTRGSKRWEQMEDAGVKDDVNDSLSWLTERLAIKVAHPSMKPKVISGKKTEKETSGGGGADGEENTQQLQILVLPFPFKKPRSE